MQFTDSAKNKPELRNCISYEVLKPIFEWLKRQKWHKDTFCDACISEDYDSNLTEIMISIRRVHIGDTVKLQTDEPRDPRHTVCCIIVYSSSKASIHLENWARYWDFIGKEQQYIDIPISQPDMFKILKEYLVNVQTCLLLEQQEFTDDVKTATDGNEIPKKSSSES